MMTYDVSSPVRSRAMNRSAILLAGLAVGLGGMSIASTADASVFSPYGFVRFDVIFDDSAMNSVQSPQWVSSETDSDENDKELSMHPRLTRFGANINPVEVGDGYTASGKIEADFQNGGRESRQTPRMRHGYAELKSSAGWELLAGQTWDLISPLWPSANNDAMMWNTGNLGDRRPQVRFTYRSGSDDMKTRFAAALGQPNAINSQDADGNGHPDGVDKALPTVQGLAEVKTSAATVGAWVHFAVDQLNMTTKDAEPMTEDITAFVVGGHFKVPLGEKAFVQGEGHFGENATDLRGGIGQGLAPDPDDASAPPIAVSTVGGWAELGMQATPSYKIVVGGALEKPNEDDLDALAEARTQNMAIYLVQHFTPLEKIKFAFEYLFWTTEYKSGNDGSANRIDAHMTFSF